MKTTEPQNYGERLKLVRKRLHLSQNDFASSLKVSNKTMSDVELCKARPNFDLLGNLRNNHNVSLDYITLGLGEPFICENDPMLTRGRRIVEHKEIEVNVELRFFLHYVLNSKFVRSKVFPWFRELYRKESTIIENELTQQNAGSESIPIIPKTII